jgi:hypothetical protein
VRHGVDDGGSRFALRLALNVSPADSAVEPAGTASRSMTKTSTPASVAASAAHNPAAPAPTIRSGTSTSKFGSNEMVTVLMRYRATDIACALISRGVNHNCCG